MKLSKRVREITPSATVALVSRVAELRAQGIDVITFAVGEPDFATPDNIAQAAKAAIDAHETKYTAVSGIAALRQAICEKLRIENNAEYTPAQISVGTGAKQPLFNTIQALIGEGDEVIVPTPCWVSYVEMIKLAGGKPVLVPCREEKDFALDIPAIAAAITPQSRAILINTPNNPTGAVYAEHALRELAELACRADLYIIVDEIYEKLVYNGKRHFSIASISPEVCQRTVLINGFSKAYAMTGWRMGYAAGPEDLIRAINAYQSHSTSCPSSIAQYAALEALRGPQESVAKMRSEFDRRRLFLINRLNAIDRIRCINADGAFYLMPNIKLYFGTRYNDRQIRNSTDFAEYLLEEAHVAVVPGTAFCADDNVRISYATSMENLQKGLDRIEAVLAKLH